MNPAQTVPFSKAAPLPGLETDSETQGDSPSRTVVLSDVLKKDVGSSALAQLDALHSLVQHEGKDERRLEAAPGAHASEGHEEPLDEYMKRFMERMTGKREEEVVAPAQPEQPLPSVAPAVEVRQPSRAPESSASLNQMRNLANASSRSAINSHQRRQLNSNILVTFLPAAVASLASSCLAVVAVFAGMRWQAGSVALLAVALALAWRFRTVSRRLLQDAHQP